MFLFFVSCVLFVFFFFGGGGGAGEGLPKTHGTHCKPTNAPEFEKQARTRKPETRNPKP